MIDFCARHYVIILDLIAVTLICIASKLLGQQYDE